MGIFYNITHGYRSKVDPDRMFTREEDARAHDISASEEVMSSFSGLTRERIVGSSEFRSERDEVERAARFLADHLKSISEQEDLAAAKAEEAARPARVDTDEMPAAVAIENHTINRDEI